MSTGIFRGRHELTWEDIFNAQAGCSELYREQDFNPHTSDLGFKCDPSFVRTTVTGNAFMSKPAGYCINAAPDIIGKDGCKPMNAAQVAAQKIWCRTGYTGWETDPQKARKKLQGTNPPRPPPPPPIEGDFFDRPQSKPQKVTHIKRGLKREIRWTNEQ